jgi:hypothetical protein
LHPTTACGSAPPNPQITAQAQPPIVSIRTGRYSTQAFTMHWHSPVLGAEGLVRASRRLSLGCSPMPGPSPREKSPGTCRFDHFTR